MLIRYFYYFGKQVTCNAILAYCRELLLLSDLIDAHGLHQQVAVLINGTTSYNRSEGRHSKLRLVNDC